MNVVFATTCKGRTDHLARTLPQNLADNPEATFVVLGYNDRDRLDMYLKSPELYQHIASGRLVVYQYWDDVPFRMAHAKNMAHRCALLEGADVVVNLDADNYTGLCFDRYVRKHFESGEEMFLWSVMIRGVLSRGISGRIAVTRSAFHLAGGYDERFETHSPDDKDFHYRLGKLGLIGKEIHPSYLRAITHNDKMRYREYSHVADCTYDDYSIKHDNTCVNYGNVGCGWVIRNFCSDPIEIKPIPTRIFGIGLHKCATTSLHTALSLLGFKSGHWRTAHWAKAIWQEINNQGRSHTLERYYALCDLPIPLLYQQLDFSYPGSKFVLTTRPEESWLRSVEKHFSYTHNRFRHQWDQDPFSHRIHERLYGRCDFERETFLSRYRRHNAEVLEYFKDRPQDLLVLDVENGHGWPELCGFLGVPIPVAPYPFVGRSQNPVDSGFDSP